MDNSFGSEPGNPFTSKHLLSGWCPECGRRRGADARCKNCDPWWTSPLVQAGVPAVLGMLFLVTTGTALVKQPQKPRGTSVTQVAGSSRLLTVKVQRPFVAPQPRTASVAPVMPSVMVPVTDPAAEAVRIQREGAYINAVLRAQDDARRSQQIAARNREFAFALQQRMQVMAQMRAQSLRSYSASPPQPQRGVSEFRSPAPIEQLITEETVVVPL
ncbi:MAG: hypothetical protein V4671_20675 [Armatimonadota bacterium]